MVVSPQSHSLFPDPTSGLFVYGERKITDEKYIINCFTVPSSYSEADSNYYEYENTKCKPGQFQNK